jgi:hypothetical protein
MYRVTAQQVTGVDGRYVGRFGGFDLSDLKPLLAGEGPDYWSRQVTYQGTCTLQQLFENDKLLRYNLLTSILLNDERIDPDTEVSYYASGNVKEVRVRKKAYRIVGNKYLGERRRDCTAPLARHRHHNRHLGRTFHSDGMRSRRSLARLQGKVNDGKN